MLLLQLHHDISRLSSSSQRRRPWPSIIRVELVLPVCLFVSLVPWRQPSSSSSLSPSPGHLRRRMMKVCINFGDIRCVVPVGDGSLAVKEVIDLAVERFRKATSKVSTGRESVSTAKHSLFTPLHLTPLSSTLCLPVDVFTVTSSSPSPPVCGANIISLLSSAHYFYQCPKIVCFIELFSGGSGGVLSSIEWFLSFSVQVFTTVCLFESYSYRRRKTLVF